jgi:hypothetical protein
MYQFTPLCSGGRRIAYVSNLVAAGPVHSSGLSAGFDGGLLDIMSRLYVGEVSEEVITA